jgi:hypothetical protein
MARPRKSDDEKRQVVSIRLNPDQRARLEAAAAENGHSLAAEIEARLGATDGLRHSGVSLTRDVKEIIREIETATGRAWDQDVKTWGAVLEAFRVGAPLWRYRPADEEHDAAHAAIADKLGTITGKQAAVVDALADLGVSVQGPDQPPLTRFSLERRRSLEQAAIKAIPEQGVRERALSLHEQLYELDAEEETIRREWWLAIEPFRQAERSGARLFWDLSERLTSQERRLVGALAWRLYASGRPGDPREKANGDK